MIGEDLFLETVAVAAVLVLPTVVEELIPKTAAVVTDETVAVVGPLVLATFVKELVLETVDCCFC